MKNLIEMANLTKGEFVTAWVEIDQKKERLAELEVVGCARRKRTLQQNRRKKKSLQAITLETCSTMIHTLLTLTILTLNHLSTHFMMHDTTGKSLKH